MCRSLGAYLVRHAVLDLEVTVLIYILLFLWHQLLDRAIFLYVPNLDILEYRPSVGRWNRVGLVVTGSIYSPKC